jgi:histidinol-phosphatase (PHP family)
LYRSLGGEIVTMGSDAHSPAQLGDHMEDARQVLREIGFREFYTYEKHRPIAHPLG